MARGGRLAQGGRLGAAGRPGGEEGARCGSLGLGWPGRGAAVLAARGLLVYQSGRGRVANVAFAGIASIPTGAKERELVKMPVAKGEGNANV